MRVTPGMMNAQVLRDLQGALAALARQQSQLSSGRRITAPSDDPAGTAQALTIRSRQTAAEQFKKNVAEARDSLAAADSVLRSVVETVTQAKETAVQGASDTSDALARQSLGSQVNQLLETLVALALSRGHGGTFLFGGQESTRSPYSVTRDANGKITAVAVNARGIDGETPAEVSEGVTVPTGVSGTSVFGATTDTTYAFDVLIRLRDSLNANDADGVRTSLDELTTVLDRVTVSSTLVGVRIGWLALLDERLTDESLVLAGTLSRVEDADIPKVVLEFQQMQTFYEAALASGARLLQSSLLNFLK